MEFDATFVEIGWDSCDFYVELRRAFQCIEYRIYHKGFFFVYAQSMNQVVVEADRWSLSALSDAAIYPQNQQNYETLHIVTLKFVQF